MTKSRARTLETCSWSHVITHQDYESGRCQAYWTEADLCKSHWWRYNSRRDRME